LSLVQAELFGGERLDANFGLGDLFEDGIERFAACLEAVGGMSSVRLAPCPLDDETAVALFELAELGFVLIEAGGEGFGFELAIAKLEAVVFSFFVRGRQFAPAADEPDRGPFGADDEAAVGVEQFAAAGDEAEPRATQAAEVHRGGERVDQPGRPEQVSGERLQVAFGLDESIGAADDTFESVESDAVAGASRREFIDPDQADAAGQSDFAGGDRLLESRAADGKELGAFAEDGIDQGGGMNVGLEEVGDDPEAIVDRAVVAGGGAEQFEDRADAAGNPFLATLQLFQNGDAFGDPLKPDLEGRDLIATTLQGAAFFIDGGAGQFDRLCEGIDFGLDVVPLVVQRSDLLARYGDIVADFRFPLVRFGECLAGLGRELVDALGGRFEVGDIAECGEVILLQRFAAERRIGDGGLAFGPVAFDPQDAAASVVKVELVSLQPIDAAPQFGRGHAGLGTEQTQALEAAGHGGAEVRYGGRVGFALATEDGGASLQVGPLLFRLTRLLGDLLDL
jgi:hypothetical protein